MFFKLIENLNNEGLQYERLLGGEGQRNSIANFYEIHPDLFQLIATHQLYTFSKNNVYDSKQFEAYQQAIIDFGIILDGCLKERDSEPKEE